jgi:hypothetical protein
MFMLVSRRYGRASMIVTSHKPFSGWGEIFGDDLVSAAMIDRLVHDAEIVALKGDSCRLRDRDLARPTRDERTELRGLPDPASTATPARSPTRRVILNRRTQRGAIFNRP